MLMRNDAEPARERNPVPRHAPTNDGPAPGGMEIGDRFAGVNANGRHGMALIDRGAARRAMGN